ncbi:hypothetical protein DQ384_26270 [Sphaerisporangium album]|uniref:Uncharacterized protein n=1 Tax=Sphaerisporangium album TaxID=509200 RepID=A0A367FC04_9ACTN|nr:hypothetical protein [Sphaerisporangium album]RCG27227.1 hypothetical protein DQ384_26270 [Sphaerisporangium album]
MSVIGQAEGIEHGTPRGYKQHLYRKVSACQECLAAHRENAKAKAPGRRAARRAETSRADAASWYDGQLDRHPEAPALRPGTVFGQDLAIGDVIDFLGRHYKIDQFTPYTGRLKAQLGAGTRIAWSGKWGMTVGPRAVIPILPRAQAAAPTPGGA